MTIRRRLALARRRDGEYFRRQVEFFKSAVERLTGHVLRDAGLIDFLRDKIQFATVRGDMRGRNRLVRAGMAIVQALRGRYHKHARGLFALAADLLL